MLSRKRSRICFVVALCLITLTLLLKIAVPNLHSARLGRAIDNSTLGFEAVLAINAPWRTDRKDSLTLAAARTGIALDWIDGVNASDIDERALPQGDHRNLPKGNLGSWRAHMNALRLVIERNLNTALILEDDADWLPEVRSQLTAFGRASQELPDMIRRASTGTASQERVPSSESAVPKTLPLKSSDTAQHRMLPLPSTSSSSQSTPYGTDWDILWLGHCTTLLPPPSSTKLSDRFILQSDSAIASSSTRQPRIFHRAHSTLCTLAYAVTQHGARKILYEHGIRNLDKGYDFALSEWCDGRTKGMGARPMCLTSSPSVFGHFWDAGGGKSDIVGVGAGGKLGGLVGGVRARLGEFMEES